MGRKITQRELRNESGTIMRGLDSGESYVVTRNGVPVGELTPIVRRQFVSREELAEAFGGAPSLDWSEFRRDVRDWFDEGGDRDEPDPWDSGPVGSSRPRR